MKKLTFLFSIFFSSFCIAQNNYALAENYFRGNEYGKATQIYKKLFDKNPFNTQYLKRLVACYQETGQFLTAEKLLNDRIKIVPSHSYLYVFLGHTYERQKQPKKAKIEYEKALQSLEKTPHNAGNVANYFKEFNVLDYAIIAYQKAQEKQLNAGYSFQIAQIYGEQAKFKLMFESYMNMLDSNENYLNLVQQYLSRYVTEDAESEKNILFRKTVLRKSISNPKEVWNVLLSWLFSKQKQYGKALIQEKALFARSSKSTDAIVSLGKLAFENNDFESAIKCFEFCIEKAVTLEEKININLFLAKISVKKNNPKTDAFFQSLFAQFGKNALTISIQIEYADFLTFHQNKPQKAILVLENALEVSTSKFDKARIKLKLGDILVFLGKYNKALIYFSQIQLQLKNHQISQEARFKVAQTSYFKGDFKWAKAQLKILKGSKTQLIANDAVQLFLKITDNEPVDSIPSGLKQLAKAELLAFQNKNDAALTEISTLFDPKKVFENGLQPGEVIYDDALFFKAKILIKLKKYEEAITAFKKIISAGNQGVFTDNVYFEIAELYRTILNQPKKASEYYQKIIFEQPSSIFLVEARKNFRKLRGDSIN